MFNVQTETSKNQQLKYKLLLFILPEVRFIITVQEINIHVYVHAWKSEQRLMSIVGVDMAMTVRK